MNQQKGENDRRKDFMISLNERMLPDRSREFVPQDIHIQFTITSPESAPVCIRCYIQTIRMWLMLFGSFLFCMFFFLLGLSVSLSSPLLMAIGGYDI